MTATLATETYAATYATKNDQGEYGIDLIDQSVERDEDGTELSREEAGWSWMKSNFTHIWDTDAADEMLSELGYRRIGAWKHESDLGGVEGWTAQVEQS